MARTPEFFKDVHPELVSELVDQSLADTLTMGMSKKVEWRCPSHGHIYEMAPFTRFRNGDAGCPYCSNRKVLKGFNDVATTNPEFLELAVNPDDLTKYTAGSSKKIQWKCPDCGHIRETSVVDVVSKGKGCPRCKHVGLIEGSNNLATTNPEIAAMLVDSSLAAKVSATSANRVLFKCDKGHTWESMVKTVVSHEGACPICEGKMKENGEKITVGDVAPHLVEEMVDESNSTCAPNSHKKIQWQCSNDPSHVWEASIAQRVRSGSGCPHCNNNRVLRGVDDLATTNPELASHLVNPDDAFRYSEKSVHRSKWLCESCGREFKAPIRSVAERDLNNGFKCSVCLGRGVRVEKRHATLGELNHPLLEEAVDPELVARLSTGSGVVVEWNCHACSKPHTYSMAVKKRVDGQGCPVKAGKQIIAGINDLWTTHPELAASLVYPEQGYLYSYGTPERLEWKCDEGHTWFASVYSRVAGNGCPECACTGTSKMEQDLAEQVKILVGPENVVVNDTSILARYAMRGHVPELDIVIPNQHVAIEFNGLFYHSYNPYGKQDTSALKTDRHFRKYQWAKECGYTLYQVWEDDWVYNRDVVLRALAAKLGAIDKLELVLSQFNPMMVEHVGARECECRVVSSRQATAFYEQNHIQGSVTGTHFFGLYDCNDRLRAVLAARKGLVHSMGEEGDYELQRYATCGVIAGGLSKLMKFAEKCILEIDPDFTRWVSFSSNDISNGSMYAKCGFVWFSESAPSYYYWGRKTGGRRVPKKSFQKRKFANKPGFVYDPKMTEIELAEANGLNRIYDAGKIKWVKPVGSQI